VDICPKSPRNFADSRNPRVTRESGRGVCSRGGGRWVTRLSARTVFVRAHARSGAARLLAALKQLHCTQEELSRRISVDPRTVRAWCSGQSRAPVSVLLLCDAWVADPALERRQSHLMRRTVL